MAAQECVKRHTRGKPLTSGEKRIVLNVFHYLSVRNADCLIEQIVTLTSE